MSFEVQHLLQLLNAYKDNGMEQLPTGKGRSSRESEKSDGSFRVSCCEYSPR